MNQIENIRHDILPEPRSNVSNHIVTETIPSLEG